MDDALSWLIEVVSGWFATAPLELALDPSAAGEGIAQSVSAAAGIEPPGFLTQVLSAMATSCVEDVATAAVGFVNRRLVDRPQHVRQRAIEFLTGIPDNVRDTLRRPADPLGVTLPPGFSVKSIKSLTAPLAGRVPRFRVGDRPIASIDLELIELLGVGGFAEVWKAAYPNMPGVTPVALKFCNDPEAARVLRHEARVLDRVMRAGKHPGIVQLRHTYLTNDPPCLEYEFVGGGNLAQLIERCRREQIGPSPDQAARFMRIVTDAVAFAHQHGIVHRDLKPQNILIEKTAAGKTRPRVADFGIGGVAAGLAAGAGAGTTIKAVTALAGSFTPLYASPQQRAGAAPDPRDDVYALGVIWYQILVCDLTAGAPTGRMWASDLAARGVMPADVELLAACLEPRPEQRPVDAAALARELKGGDSDRRRVADEAVVEGNPLAPDRVDELPQMTAAHRVRLAGWLTDLLGACRRRDRPWYRDGWLAVVWVGCMAAAWATFAGIAAMGNQGGRTALLWIAATVTFGAVAAGLVAWRRYRVAAATDEAEEVAGRVAAGYPEVVAAWGGPDVLDRPDTVAHLRGTLADGRAGHRHSGRRTPKAAAAVRKRPAGDQAVDREDGSGGRR